MELAGKANRMQIQKIDSPQNCERNVVTTGDNPKEAVHDAQVVDLGILTRHAHCKAGAKGREEAATRAHGRVAALAFAATVAVIECALRRAGRGRGSGDRRHRRGGHRLLRFFSAHDS